MSNLDAIIAEAIKQWSVEDQEDFEERAAIIEYYDGLSREAAERAAFLQLRKARKERKQ